MVIAVGYFGDEPITRRWLGKFNRVIGSEPINLCNTFSGMDRVEDRIMRLMRGMTA
jgi:uncharacterized protein (DUF2384 family)